MTTKLLCTDRGYGPNLQANLFLLIYINDLTPQDKIKSREAIMMLERRSPTEKPKVIMVFNVKPTREWLSRENTSRPKSSLEKKNYSNNQCVGGIRSYGSGCSQLLHSDQHAAKVICRINGCHENNRCDSGHC